MRRPLQCPRDLAASPTVAALNVGIGSVGAGGAHVLAEAHGGTRVVLLGNEVDHAANGVGAVHRRATVQLNVNPFNGRKRHVQEVGEAFLIPGPAGDATPVYQHQRVGRAQGAQVGRGSAETRDDLKENEAGQDVIDVPQILVHIARSESGDVQRAGLLRNRRIGPG